MLFEGGLYFRTIVAERIIRCDLMLFEGGLYSALRSGRRRCCCDLT